MTSGFILSNIAWIFPASENWSKLKFYPPRKHGFVAVLFWINTIVFDIIWSIISSSIMGFLKIYGVCY